MSETAAQLPDEELLADVEEAINVAFAREDHRALDVALTELERHCRGQYGAPAPTAEPGKAESEGDRGGRLDGLLENETTHSSGG